MLFVNDYISFNNFSKTNSLLNTLKIYHKTPENKMRLNLHSFYLYTLIKDSVNIWYIRSIYFGIKFYGERHCPLKDPY